MVPHDGEGMVMAHHHHLHQNHVYKQSWDPQNNSNYYATQALPGDVARQPGATSSTTKPRSTLSTTTYSTTSSCSSTTQQERGEHDKKPPQQRQPSPQPTDGRSPTTSYATGMMPPNLILQKKVVGWNQAYSPADHDDQQEQEPMMAEETRVLGNRATSNYARNDHDKVPLSTTVTAATGSSSEDLSSQPKTTDSSSKKGERTRREWNQVFLCKALKPYCQMICSMDDDLPNREDLENDGIDETVMAGDAYLKGKHELIKIREKMLEDVNLNEKEVAAFFEGYRLFQAKVHSLQSQLEGLKATQLKSTAPSYHQSHSTTMIGEMFSPRKASSVPRSTSILFKNANDAVSTSGTVSSHRGPVRRSQDDDDDLAIEKPEIVTRTESRPIGPERRFSTKNAGPYPSLRMMSIQRIRNETSGREGSEDIRQLLEQLEEAERRQKKLEKQLAKAGVVIAEDIPYNVAKEKVESIAGRMEAIGFADSKDKRLQEEYFLLEREMEKYTTALQLTDDWIEEQEDLDRRWEQSIAAGNEKALKQLRRHMPVDVRNRSETSLATDLTPNGKVLPMEIAKKFKRTNVLQLLRIDPEDIVPMHAATLENMRVAGLTLTERRALHDHLKNTALRWKAMQSDKMADRKWTWFCMMKSNFKENVDAWQRHVQQYGPPENHRYWARDNPDAGGCRLIGKQCPVKADKAIDYDGDFGFPEGPEYFRADVKKSDVGNPSKAKQEAEGSLRERTSRERTVVLKAHYKGKVLQATLASASCDSMDHAMDTMEEAQEKLRKARLTSEGQPSAEAKKKETMCIQDALKEFKLSALQMAERSGMQLTGKRDATADQRDIRSIIEVSLCEQVIEMAVDFFDRIEARMVEAGLKDAIVKVTVQQLRTLLGELHERNISTVETLWGQVDSPKSRERNSQCAGAASVQGKFDRTGVASPALPGGPPAALAVRGAEVQVALTRRSEGRPIRGHLLAGLQGRGGSGRGGGHGGLRAVIAACGKQEPYGS